MTVTAFLLAGQSNMSGRAPASALPEAYRAPPPQIVYDYVNSFGTDRGVAPQSSREWIPLGLSPKTPSTPEDHFGPEISLGHALADRLRDQRLAVVKHGRGGTSLAFDWSLDCPDGLYAEMLAQIRRNVSLLAARGDSAKWAGLFWAQGEADATQLDWARAYEANLRRLFARIREDLKSPDLPVVFALTADGKACSIMKYAEEVRRAQRTVAASDARSALIDCDDFTLIDEVHYDGPSQIRLGRAMAEAYFRLVKE